MLCQACLEQPSDYSRGTVDVSFYGSPFLFFLAETDVTEEALFGLTAVYVVR